MLLLKPCGPLTKLWVSLQLQPLTACPQTLFWLRKQELFLKAFLCFKSIFEKI
jgi:hypothetical protein